MKTKLLLALALLCTNAFAQMSSNGYDQLDDTSTYVPSEDEATLGRLTPARAKHMNLRNNSGTEIGTNTTPLITGEKAATFNGSLASPTTGDIIASMDASGYTHFSLQLSLTSANVQVQVSNDNVTFNAVPMIQAGSPTTTPQTTVSTSNTYNGDIDGKFVRVVANSNNAGTVSATLFVMAGPRNDFNARFVGLLSGTNTIGSIQNISGTISLPTNASTLPAQNTGNALLSSIDSKLGSLGQKTMAGSAPVVIASDQTAIPTSVTSSVLPIGASTESTLAAFSAKFSVLGQNTMANSQPVVLASNHSTIVVNQLRATTYVQSAITVGTSQVEAKVGGSRAANRKNLTIHNNCTNTFYVGPTGVTTANGRPIFKNQFYSTDDADLAIYLIAGSSLSSCAIIEEKGN